MSLPYFITLRFSSLDDAAWLAGIVEEAINRQSLSECSKGILRDTLKKCEAVSVRGPEGTVTAFQLKSVRLGNGLASVITGGQP